MDNEEQRIEIAEEADIAHAIFEAHFLSKSIGFSNIDQFMIATAVSELARNIFLHAGSGVITLRPLERAGEQGIEVVAEDGGPGINDINQALGEGYSTKGTLGLGLPGAKRLTDEFVFDEKRLLGTQIVVRKWL
ncbi:anti-sigma regulatory factor [Marinobacter caseinilyticus]|uniref:anti-sigma regulatory factor n=1 Tax=Marinobacter caseinilyticus TaxID=2692195 RepID=UPI001A943115|nr:anti-sigma regulatory factor [Marinobacter caseinilyticus]